jgi:hypothetical protein
MPAKWVIRLSPLPKLQVSHPLGKRYDNIHHDRATVEKSQELPVADGLRYSPSFSELRQTYKEMPPIDLMM